MSDMELARLMDMVGQEDKQSLLSMLSDMAPEDVAFFKGYVSGYADGVTHAGMALSDGFDAGVERDIS